MDDVLLHSLAMTPRSGAVSASIEAGEPKIHTGVQGLPHGNVLWLRQGVRIATDPGQGTAPPVGTDQYVRNQAFGITFPSPLQGQEWVEVIKTARSMAPAR